MEEAHTTNPGKNRPVTDETDGTGKARKKEITRARAPLPSLLIPNKGGVLVLASGPDR